MTSAAKQEGLVGVVWTVVTPDGVATGAVGRARADRREPLSADAKVQTGSIAKTLIAAGILRLVTEGRLELDRPVAPLLPDVEFVNPWASTDPVRVRHLLDHTSGLDDARLWQVFSLRASPDTPLSASIAPGRVEVRSRPGSRLSYSNLGYTVLGMVIEQVTGERYEHYLDAHVLHPLGMRDSTLRFVSQQGAHADGRLAMGHFEGGRSQAAIPLFLRPAGQFTTTATDMARFARFLMSDGHVDGAVFIAPHLLQAMGRPTTTEAALAGLVEAGYGLGLNTRDRHGVRGKCHIGTTVGFRSNFCLFPEAQKAFFVAVNSDVESADYERLDALLVRELGLSAAAPIATQPPPEGVSHWGGIYVLVPNRMASLAYLDRVLSFATVRWDGRHLILSPFQGTPRRLSPVGGSLFRAEDRTRASHVLHVSRAGRIVISDGFRSYERISLWYMLPLWCSLVAGLAGLVHLVAVGTVRMLRRRLSVSDPVFLPFLSAAALLLPAPLFLRQSALQLGDPTLASLSLAVVTGWLPLGVLVGLWRSMRRGSTHRCTWWDRFAMVAVLQWSIVLAVWGLLPLRLWA